MDKRERRAERYQMAKMLGVCVKCHKPAIPGRTLCPDCVARKAERQKGRGRRRGEEGRCPVCGRTLSSDYRYKTCPVCLEKARRYYRTKALRECEADD